MTVTAIPVMEVDGVPSSKTLLAEHNCSLQVCSHQDPTLVVLRFLSQNITLEASALHAAIKDCCSQGQWDNHTARSARV